MSKKEDNTFYELLGVERTATTGQIRKGYYNQARIWHPDKNPDDPSSEERFKRISQAYQVLSDPNLREVYDKSGEAGLKAKAEGGGMQLSDVIDALFGGGAFEPLFGSVATLSVVQELVNGPLGEEKEEPLISEARRAQQSLAEAKIVQELATRLLERVNLATDPAFKQKCTEFAFELCDAPGGIELLQMVATIYVQKAKQNSNQFFARVGASLAETGHKASTFWSIGKHMWGARKAAKQLEKEQKEQEDERQKQLELQEKKRILEFLQAQRSEGQPFLCIRCKAVMNAPRGLAKGAFVTCAACNAQQPLNPLFPPLDPWTCGRCTLINEGGSKCNGCGGPRVATAPPVALPPAPSPVVVTASPPPYSSNNNSNNNNNVNVFAVPPPNAAPPACAADEWACPNCTLLNPGSQAECAACGGKRQLPMAVPLPVPSAIPVVPAVPVVAVPVVAVPQIPIATPIHIPRNPQVAEFHVGDTVLVAGLVNRPELNGHLGVISEVPDGESKTRYVVRMGDMDNFAVSLKPENLVVPPEEARESPQQAALQKKLAAEGLTLAWKAGKMLLEDRVRKIVEAVFTLDLAAGGDVALKEQKAKRVQALLSIGNTYQEASILFKEKLAKEGKEEQNLLKGLAQMASGGEEEAMAAQQATVAAAQAASARREAAAERKAQGVVEQAPHQVPIPPEPVPPAEASPSPVTIHAPPPDLTPGVDDTD